MGDTWAIKDHQLGLCSSEDVGKAKTYWTMANAQRGVCAASDVGQVKVVWTMEDFRAGRCTSNDVGAKKQMTSPPTDDFPTRLAAIEDAIKNGKVPSARDEYRKVFHLIGGTQALSEWAKNNPEKFYQMHAKLVPQVIEADMPKEAIVVNLSWLVNRPGWSKQRHHDALKAGTTLVMNQPKPTGRDIADAEIISETNTPNAA
jgi:hypothetical protein